MCRVYNGREEKAKGERLITTKSGWGLVFKDRLKYETEDKSFSKWMYGSA